MITGGTVAAGAGAGAAAGAASATGHGGAKADGTAVGSPGVVSGDIAEVPVALPVNVAGNTVNVAGLLNPAFGSFCLNG